MFVHPLKPRVVFMTMTLRFHKEAHAKYERSAMSHRSWYRSAGAVLTLVILFICIGVIAPEQSATAEFFRGCGVLVTLIGMVSMIAARQSAADSHIRPDREDAPP
jgi:protein-S-isoprenylcysteine O-methyltransferase Ste14